MHPLIEILLIYVRVKLFFQGAWELGQGTTVKRCHAAQGIEITLVVNAMCLDTLAYYL